MMNERAQKQEKQVQYVSSTLYLHQTFWQDCHIADVQVRKTETKSIPVPCWEIHYSKVNSLHSVFPCAWFLPQTGHIACRGICWDLSPKCGLTTPCLHVFCTSASAPSHTESLTTSTLARKALPEYFLAIISHGQNPISYGCQLTINQDLHFKRCKRQSGKQGRGQQWLLQTFGDSITLVL